MPSRRRAPFDHDLETGERHAFGLEPAPAARGRPLFGVTLQAPLDLGSAPVPERRRSTRPATRTSSSWRWRWTSTRRPSNSSQARALPPTRGATRPGALSAPTSPSRWSASASGCGLRRAPRRAALLFSGAVPVGPTRLAGRGVTVVGPFRCGAGVTATTEHNAALGQLRPGQFRRGGGILGAPACLFHRGGRDHAGR